MKTEFVVKADNYEKKKGTRFKADSDDPSIRALWVAGTIAKAAPKPKDVDDADA